MKACSCRGDTKARQLADYFAAEPEDGPPQEAGLSLAAWRRHRRMLTSLSLLAEGKSIGEVAHAVGYESAPAFSTAFKQCFGGSPSTYG